MTRQRAQDAFARVGTARLDDLAASQLDSDTDSVSAIENDGDFAASPAVFTAINKTGVPASDPAGGKAKRRVGRPRGPERVALTIRILTATDARLTAAVEATGDSPQYIVDAALKAYLDALGIPDK